MSEWDDQRTRRISPEDQARLQAGQRPGYDQPGAYGQQTYGQNQYGAPANPFGAAGNQAFGIASIVTSLIGGIVVLVSFTAIDWFSSGSRGISFSDLHDIASNDGFTGFGNTYFSWLAWAFLIVGVVAAVLASFPSPALRAFRAIGVVVGVAAAGLVFLAIKPNGAGSYSDVLSNSEVGFWMAPIGFVLIAIGAGIGPRRV